ncbi:hypothetical protein AB5I41_20390 [Sphingomonas sp. MMS24-JH45]
MTRPRLAPAVLLSWLLAAAILLAIGAADVARLRFLDPDDAMRLLEVRDWLAGQSWWDVGQHRLNGGDFPMHWSRLVDLPLAAAMALLDPVPPGTGDVDPHRDGAGAAPHPARRHGARRGDHAPARRGWRGTAGAAAGAAVGADRVPGPPDADRPSRLADRAGPRARRRPSAARPPDAGAGRGGGAGARRALLTVSL